GRAAARLLARRRGRAGAAPTRRSAPRRGDRAGGGRGARRRSAIARATVPERPGAAGPGARTGHPPTASTDAAVDLGGATRADDSLRRGARAADRRPGRLARSGRRRPLPIAVGVQQLAW